VTNFKQLCLSYANQPFKQNLVYGNFNLALFVLFHETWRNIRAEREPYSALGCGSNSRGVLRDLGSETAVLVAVYEYRSRFVSNIVLLQN
jgi:hypothetical protein